MISLDRFLEESASRRWAWGEPMGDCIQFGLSWARERTGRQLEAPLAYQGRAEAKAFLEAHGGLLEVVAQWMRANGFEPTSSPEDGDIGVAPIAAPEPYATVIGSVVIRCGPWWIGRRAPRGFSGIQGEIPAWRIS